MTAKEFLRRVAWMDEVIERKCVQLEELRTKAENVSKILTQDLVQSSVKPGSHEDLLVKIIDLEHEINADIDRYVEYKRRAMALIDTLEDERYTGILYRKYLEHKRWEEIAVELNYAYRYVTELHGQALQALDKKTSENLLLF